MGALTTTMNEDEQKLLDDLLDAESGLHGREIDFIDSLDRSRNIELSVKQEAWLRRIADRVL